MSHHGKLVSSIVVQDPLLPPPGVEARSQDVDELDAPNYLDSVLTVPAGGNITLDFAGIGMKPVQLVVFANHHVKLVFNGVPTDSTDIRGLYASSYDAAWPTSLKIDNLGEVTEAVCRVITLGINP